MLKSLRVYIYICVCVCIYVFVYMYYSVQVVDGKAKFMADPHNFNSPIADLWRNSLVLCFFPDQTWGQEDFVYLWSSTKGRESHISTLAFLLLWEKFGHAKSIWASICIFNFYYNLMLFLLLRIELLPCHLIWCLSKACVGCRCMCSSHWIQWQFLTTRIQLSAVNGPSILKTPIAFSKYSLNSC